MKLIGADKILRLLGDRPVLRRRKKLRRDRRVEHVEQHLCETLIPAGVREIADEMAHQRLRDRRIHSVHRHMIAVVRRPAERELREIARADDEAI